MDGPSPESADRAMVVDPNHGGNPAITIEQTPTDSWNEVR
jgi:hypothetical protein